MKIIEATYDGSEIKVAIKTEEIKCIADINYNGKEYIGQHKVHIPIELTLLGKILVALHLKKPYKIEEIYKYENVSYDYRNIVCQDKNYYVSESYDDLIKQWKEA
jgi:hypothetical protein